MRNLGLKLAVLAAACVSASGAYAAPITCNSGQSSGLRVLTIETTAGGSCFGTGLGNLGNTDLTALIGGGASVLERDEANSGAGFLNISGHDSQVQGTWSFTGSGATSYLYFHFGNGGDSSDTNPDYFIFALNTPGGTASGTWTTGGTGAKWNGLSNIAVVSRGTPVPEPTTLALLGMGLVGLGLTRRRKKV
jgi:hypothetical protein